MFVLPKCLFFGVDFLVERVRRTPDDAIMAQSKRVDHLLALGFLAIDGNLFGFAFGLDAL